MAPTKCTILRNRLSIFVARSHPAVDLHALKQILQQMARAVFQHIKCSLFFAVAFGWNDHLHSFIHSLLHEGLTVVAFISQKLLVKQTLNQSINSGAPALLPAVNL